MAGSHVERTMKELKKQGFLRTAIVEKYNVHAFRPNGGRGVRQDLFGIVDILSLQPGRGFVGIQVCGADFSEHVKKLTVEKSPECLSWLLTPGGFLELWGWRKLLVKRGGKAKKWTPRVHIFGLDDFRSAWNG